jgi:hypothetical protein
MLIHLNQFKGIAPKIDPHLLPQQMAQQAVNCRFGSGIFEPWHAPSSVASLAKTGTKKSLYRYAGQYWFHWLEDVNVVKAPVALDAYGRVYWTGEDYPRVGGSDIVTSGGGTAYPAASYRMGVPAPGIAPSAAVSGVATDTLPPVDRVYAFTYVNQYGGEGPPSDPSTEISISNGQTATVTLPGGAPTGNYNVVQKNVYRTVKGSNNSDWMLVGSVPVASTTFLDSMLDADLTTLLPSLTWDGPPDDLAGLIDHPMGSLVGFSGKELLFSEPYRPHAWPYRYAVSDPIVAIGIYGTSILVTTTGKPYVFSGNDPANMTSERLEKGEACVSKRGFVDMGVACIFPGPSGLWGAGLGDVSLLTGKIMQLEDWRAYCPESLLGGYYDGNYIGFYDNGSRQGGFVLDTLSGDFTEIDTYATAVWNDPTSGRLFLVVDGEVVEWNGGPDLYTATWHSRPFVAPSPLNMACGKVVAADYPVTLKVYADGAWKYTKTVADSKPFWLPSGFRALTWEVEVSGTNKVSAVSLAGSIRELQQQ